MEDAATRAAAAVRRLGHALVAHVIEPDDLARLALEADQWAELLESRPAYERTIEDMRRDLLAEEPADGAVMRHFDRCPVCGPHHPFAVSFVPRRDGDEVSAAVLLGAGCEGAPGRAHGGVVAALFDDATAYLGRIHHHVWFGGELRVRYLRPTPVGVPLEVRARIAGVDGRKVFTEASASAGGVVVAEAACTKLLVPPPGERA
ncbi:MAG TPA: PaaI family thioesterase [Acidimicrobiales bacterium]|nr:PaaI family thioesterase [Acidimicrobiales bacterium]